MNDPSVGRLKLLDEFTLTEIEAVRLILRGDSIIDWQRLHFADDDEARRFLITQEFRPDEAADRARLESIKNEAIAYLRRHVEFPIPKPVERASVEELMLLASGKGHRQVCACTILKAMHIIHHLDGRELLFSIPMADQDVFHLVEEKVYRVIGGMLAAGFPITEFVGGRKNKDSLYTKLLSKADTTAAAIYDKLRFRIVTRSADDILPVLLYLSERLLPFNYVVPSESINTIFHFRSYCETKPHLKALLRIGLIEGVNKKLESAQVQIEQCRDLLTAHGQHQPKSGFVLERLEEAERMRKKIHSLLNNPLLRKLL